MKILVITHTFPPSKHSNAKRPQYLVRAFLEEGWEVDVMTSYIGVEIDQPEALEHPNLRIERVNDPVRRIQGKLGKKCLKGLSKLVGFAANGFLFPDFCALWARRVFRKIQQKGVEYDRVLAFVFPPSVLLSGSYGIVDHRWVFDFQESVTPQFERFPRKSFFQRAMLGRLQALEKKTLHAAGKVVFTADSNRATYLERGIVPSERAVHLPYFFDEMAFRDSPKIGERFEIGYYGNFDLTGARSPEIFFKSLAGFLDRFPEARAVTRFVFYGAWLANHHSFIADLDLQEVCEINTAVPYEEYLQRLQVSPVLLLIVAEEHNLFMPSKIVDYFGAQRPILAFVPDGSEMKGVLESAGMEAYSCLSGDVEQGIDALSRLWTAFQEGQLKSDPEKTSAWSSSELVPKYLKLLRDLPENKILI